MLCSECYEEIIESKEIQIKGSIFCKKCVETNKLIKKEVVAKCHTCSNLIYNDERIHESSISNDKGMSLWLSIIDGKSEKLIRCSSAIRTR